MTTGDETTGEPPEHGRHEETEGPQVNGMSPVVSRRREEGVEVLTLSGELDITTVQDVGPVLDDALHSGAGRLVVDLSGVSFADSSALNLLLRTHTRTVLHVAGPLHPFVGRLFEVTGITGVLNLHASLPDALRAAARGM